MRRVSKEGLTTEDTESTEGARDHFGNVTEMVGELESAFDEFPSRHRAALAVELVP